MGAGIQFSLCTAEYPLPHRSLHTCTTGLPEMKRLPRFTPSMLTSPCSDLVSKYMCSSTHVPHTSAPE